MTSAKKIGESVAGSGNQRQPASKWRKKIIESEMTRIADIIAWRRIGGNIVSFAHVSW